MAQISCDVCSEIHSTTIHHRFKSTNRITQQDLLIKGLYEFVKLYTEGTEPRRNPAVRRKPVQKRKWTAAQTSNSAQSWLTSDVLVLAKQMYESRDFGAMPILADALQDAGCDNEDILNHCRTEGVHIRGCWVVDLVLGKE